MDEKKIYQIQLYAAHDLDLITYKNVYKANMAKAIYCCLKAFVKGEVFVISMPDRRETVMNLRRRYRCKLRLDVDNDRQEIELVEKIAKGYRNNFFKNLLRQYLRMPLTELFLYDAGDYPFFCEKFEAYKKGLRQADVAGMTKKQFLQLSLSVPDVLSEPKAATKKAIEIVENVKAEEEKAEDAGGILAETPSAMQEETFIPAEIISSADNGGSEEITDAAEIDDIFEGLV